MTDKKNVIVRIAGAAGDGIASAGEMFGKTCSRSGLHVMAYNAFQSAIRGGHVWLQLNVGEEKTRSHGEEPEVALLLNKTSPALHVPQMKSGGVVFYNAAKIEKEDIESIRDDLTYYGINYKEELDPSIPPVMANALLNGALLTALNLDTDTTLDFIKDKFGKKGEEIVSQNQEIFKIGCKWAKANVKDLGVHLKGDGIKRMFMTGNDALGMGLLAHGLKFYCAYPMSPSTGVLHYLSRVAPKDKVLIKQAADEIAVINMVIGAAHAGVRSACATAGGGFALMVEALGLAGMLEEPIVVIDVMRGGPSTGIPTKQEQNDLNLVMGGSGDFPKMIVAPRDVEDAFYQSGRALNLAEKYQTPIIVLSDMYLSEHYQTSDDFDFKRIPIERGKLVTEHNGDGPYLRFKDSADGVSPRLRPGAESGMYCSPSDEHDERGIVVSDVLAGLPEAIEARNIVHPKRMRKLETMKKEDVQLPSLEGPSDAEVTLMSWGATYDVVRDAVETLNANGKSVNHLHFTDLFPLPEERVLEVLNSCKRIVAVENNISNQWPTLLRAQTGFSIKESINRFDGEPFTTEYICRDFEALMSGSKREACAIA